MRSEELMFHLASIISVGADLCVGIVALSTWKRIRMKGFLFLAVACFLYLIDSAYAYLSGLWGLGLLTWPFAYESSLQMHFLTQWISIAAQICFVFAIALIATELKARPGTKPSA